MFVMACFDGKCLVCVENVFIFDVVNATSVCLDSSAGQSDSLVSCRSRVRIPPEAPIIRIIDPAKSNTSLY